jgi:hypothetical protein
VTSKYYHPQILQTIAGANQGLGLVAHHLANMCHLPLQRIDGFHRDGVSHDLIAKAGSNAKGGRVAAFLPACDCV